MQINFEEFQQWIAALDSGEYRQTTGKLQRQEGYCCLGVGCKVLIKTPLLVDRLLLGGFPERQPNAPQWLKEIDDDFARLTGRTLSCLNDDHGYTFPEIVTMLELVYIHKILD
jgi:hypothetical protein